MKTIKKITVALFLTVALTACKKTNDANEYEVPNEDQFTTSMDVAVLLVSVYTHKV